MLYPDAHRMDPDAIRRHLRTGFLGRTIVYTASTPSTNEDAKAAGAGYPDGTVFMAGVQTGGKGRVGRKWSSPPGGIYMSAVLRPSAPPSLIPALSIVAGHSVARAIRETTGLAALLKWPNDVLVEGKKVCGVLCEMVTQPDDAPVIVVGIGVNANVDVSRLPQEVRQTASSLKAFLGRETDTVILTATILNGFEDVYLQFLEDGLARIAGPIAEILAFVGLRVVVRKATAADPSQVSGVFRGIDCEGRAVLELPGGERKAFSAGDLSLRAVTC